MEWVVSSKEAGDKSVPHINVTQGEAAPRMAGAALSGRLLRDLSPPP